VTGREGRRRKQLLGDPKKTGRYGKLKEEVLDRTLWRTRLERGCGPVVRQSTELKKTIFYLTTVASFFFSAPL
jgi:hypothetical protein